MTAIEWDKVDERQYDYGVDRCVFYPNGAPGVPWNGVVSIEEGIDGGEVEGLYLDGYKYFDLVGAEEFSGSITAFSYPKELDACLGRVYLAPGMLVGMQRKDTFGLSWRTKSGNGANGEAGYKIHMLYNVTAKPPSRVHDTVDDSPDLSPLQWDLSTVPVIPGIGIYDPTSDPNDWTWPEGVDMPGWPVGPDGNTPVPGWKSIVYTTIESTLVDPDTLNDIENILYGTTDLPAYMPSPVDTNNILNGVPSTPNPPFPWPPDPYPDPTPDKYSGTVYHSLVSAGSSPYRVETHCPKGKALGSYWLTGLTRLSDSSSDIIGVAKFDGSVLTVADPIQPVGSFGQKIPLPYGTKAAWTLDGQALVCMDSSPDLQVREWYARVYTATDAGTVKETIVALPSLPTETVSTGGVYSYTRSSLIASPHGNRFIVYASSYPQGSNGWIAHRYQVEANGDVTFIDTNSVNHSTNPLGGVYNYFPGAQPRTQGVDTNVAYTTGLYAVLSGGGYRDVAIDFTGDPLEWLYPTNSLVSPNNTAVRNGDNLSIGYGPIAGMEGFIGDTGGKGLTFWYSDGLVVYSWDGSTLVEQRTILFADETYPYLGGNVFPDDITPMGNIICDTTDNDGNTGVLLLNPYGETPSWTIKLALNSNGFGAKTPDGGYANIYNWVEVADGVLVGLSSDSFSSGVAKYVIPTL